MEVIQNKSTVSVASGVSALGLFAGATISQIEYPSSLTQSTLNTSLALRTEPTKKAGRVNALPALLCDCYIEFKLSRNLTFYATLLLRPTQLPRGPMLSHHLEWAQPC